MTIISRDKRAPQAQASDFAALVALTLFVGTLLILAKVLS
jgi:hypothetical protein